MLFALSACMALSSCSGGGKGGDTEILSGGDITTVNTETLNTEPQEIDPTGDLALDTDSDSENGAFYDAFPDGSDKWTVKSENTSAVAKDGMLQVTMKEYGDDRILRRKGSIKTAERFELEFRLRVTSEGRRVGFRFDYNGARIYMLVYPDAVQFRGAKTDLDDINLTILNDWHIYKIIVDGETAHFYFDGKYVISFEPQTGSYTGGFTIFGAAIDGRDLRFDIDYISYKPLESKITLIDVINGAQYTNTSRLSLSVRVDSDISGEADEVIYRANGVRIGSSNKKNLGYLFDWENIKPGSYIITACYGNYESVGMKVLFGEADTENSSVKKAESEVSTAGKLLGSYELTYKIAKTGSSRLTVRNGSHKLSLSYSGENITVLTKDGEKTVTGGAGDYCLLADGSTAWLYLNSRLLFSFTMPADFTYEGITSEGEISDIKVTGFNRTFYRFDVSESLFTELDDFGNTYAAEFIFDSGKDAEITLFDGNYKAALRIESGTVYGLTAPKLMPEETPLTTLSDGEHCAELRVSGGIALLYIDGKWAGSLRLPASTAGRHLSIRGTVSFELRSYEDRYYLELDFENDSWKDYLTASESGVLSVSAGSLVLGAGEGSYTVTTENFAGKSDYAVTADFSGKTSGVFYLLARYTNEYSGIYAGYNFDSGRYEIRSSSSVNKTLYADAPKGETEFRLTVNGDTVTLYVNGNEILSGKTSIKGYANSGIMTDGGKASVRRISYCGDGYVQASQYVWLDSNGKYPDIVELEDGTLLMADEGTGMLSDDGGTTWKSASGYDTSYFGKNAIVLQSGKLLCVKRSSASGAKTSMDLAYISSDGGKTFSGPFQIQGKKSYRIAMNCKLTQASSGRVFFVTGETGHAVEHSARTGIYYSDNDGMTWKKPKTEINYMTTGMNLQEGCVVDLGNGTLRLYVRSDMGFLYYSDSTDNGETWDLDFKPTQFASVCSAFNVERDPDTGYIWLAWEYNCENDNGTVQYPRTRVGLAVSTDNGESYRYVADIDDYSTGTGAFHWNIGINITSEYIFVTVIKAVPVSGGTENRNYVVRLEKNKVTALERFTALHTLVSGNFKSEYYDSVLENSLIVSDGSEYLAGEWRTGNEYKGGETYVSLESIAELISGSFSADGTEAAVTLGKIRWSFSADSNICETYESVQMKNKAKMVDGRLCIAIEDAARLLELKTAEGERYFAIYYSLYDMDFAMSAINSWAD